jgi:predicted neuraminidase
MHFSFLKNLVFTRIFWSRLLLLIGMVLVVAAVDWVQRVPLQTYALVSPISKAAPEAAASLPSLQLTAQGNIPMPADTPAAHASTLLAMPSDSPAEVMAFWFAGTRESAADVQIAFSWFNRATQAWMPARFVVNREALGAQLGHGVRRIGNPVAWLDASGRMHLFVVATGLGGWAAGRIVQLRQTTVGLSPQDVQFEAVRTLPLSWLFNTSHLVRAAPMALADGGMLLPVYFELGIKYPVALHFGPSGDYRGQTRMSSQDHWLQPSVVATGAGTWVAFLRDNNANGNIGRVQSTDAGQSWQDLPSLPMVNPDASVAAQALPSGALVLAHNPLPTGRQRLDLSMSADGAAWQTMHTLEQGDERSEFSYPALAAHGGNLWVTYTQQRQRIAWQRFSVGQDAAQTTTAGKAAP